MSAKSFAESTTFYRSVCSRQRECWRRPLAFAVLLFVLLSWKLSEWFYGRNVILNQEQSPFPVFTDWDDIPSSEKLLWVRCELPGMFPLGRGYMCARLTVPMDYQRPLTQSSDNPRVHVALVLLPALGHGLGTGRFSESPLLLNPGGPGGPGTTFTFPPFGPAIQAAAGGNIDIIGFDPRGIGATTPRADCFVDTKPGEDPSTAAKNLATMHRLTWLAMAHDIGLPNSTAGALDQLAQRARALSKLCSQKDVEEGGFRYMATPNVAADMKSIITAHDTWLEENGFDTTPLGAGVLSPSEASPPSTKGKLVYWGFSYGTFLGQTFAAMYPDAVGRLILDGVVDSREYNMPTWISGMQDADAVFERFFYYCHLAKDACALYRQGDDGSEQVKQRYEQTMAKLRADPLIVVSRMGHMPIVLMEADIRKLLFTSLYSPIKVFPLLASLLNRLYVGDDLSDVVVAPDFGFTCDADFKLVIYPEESSKAISCSDRGYKRNETLGEIYGKLSEVSSFADVFFSPMIHCEGWDIEAKFPSPDWNANLQSPDPVNTSFPILFVGNTYDPVTPLSSAVEMSRKFTNAGVFELEAEGHCTLAATSICAIQKFREYLHKGVVPPPVTVAADGTISGWDKCKADERPWKPFPAEAAAAVDGVRAEDLRVLQGLRDVHDEIVGRLTPPLKVRLR
ncbi:hypothetical protein CORC01_08799 [Colletotrichum orchidophilum]|uniref:Peptidase S33 tripeptidyl aminopeptidase-like C-terminal domain-containing protein n=1 Tax=Colletotrichum orchidophilum TaxID=1209926 RepID=A0A1G4B3H4_9PEZI|nr:uncharacterized protein CORC01_08799 [Colletotrichum orchidophilum]OHE95947.1 hypothetical protein CORC01_08799 [Colletotrichum orchidophilum]